MMASKSGVPYSLGNLGAGALIYKETVDVLGTDTAQLRSLTGSDGITVTQNTNEIDIKLTSAIYVQSAEPVSPAVNSLWFW
jgi:hypothetical protein